MSRASLQITLGVALICFGAVNAALAEPSAACHQTITFDFDPAIPGFTNPQPDCAANGCANPCAKDADAGDGYKTCNCPGSTEDDQQCNLKYKVSDAPGGGKNIALDCMLITCTQHGAARSCKLEQEEINSPNPNITRYKAYCQCVVPPPQP